MHNNQTNKHQNAIDDLAIRHQWLLAARRSLNLPCSSEESADQERAAGDAIPSVSGRRD